jgi:hypothetical protein
MYLFSNDSGSQTYEDSFSIPALCTSLCSKNLKEFDTVSLNQYSSTFPFCGIASLTHDLSCRAVCLFLDIPRIRLFDI